MRGEASVVLNLRTAGALAATPAVSLFGESIAPAGWRNSVTSSSLEDLPLPDQTLRPLATGSVSVLALASQVNAKIEDTDHLTVPQGTQEIVLTYKVTSSEYPDYVMAQTFYNDVWSLDVIGPRGEALFQSLREVNSQLYAAPSWQPDKTTGEIQHVINVGQLTIGGDVGIHLTASATNIGDAQRPTWVSAELTFIPRLGITALEPVTTSNRAAISATHISLPRDAATNTYPKRYKVAYTAPDAMAIGRVTVDVVDARGNVIAAKILDEGPGAKVVQSGPQELELDLTIDTSNSSPFSGDPNFDEFRYRITLTGTEGANTQTTTRLSSVVNALWDIGDAVNRFGFRDSGGDGWASLGTYRWITEGGNPLPAINDVSGEHARNIGHQTHRRGTDIDTYHFTGLVNPVNGTRNYLALRDAAIAATTNDAAATATVRDFIVTARAELDALTQQAEVARVIFARGTASGPLPAGWVQQLMESGRIGQGLNLGLTAWSNPSVAYRNDHNDHVHIDLADDQLDNAVR